MFPIGGNLWKFMSSYLDDQEKYVKINKEFWNRLNSNGGPPQRSILGSLLSLICTNYLPNANPSLESNGYAELISNESELEQGEMVPDRMEVNSSTWKLPNVKSSMTTSMNGEQLQPATAHRHVGLMLSSNVTWNENWENRVAKALGAWF